MKTYSQPDTKVVKIHHMNIICESLGLNSGPASVTDGTYNSLARENTWDIWGNDADEE